METTPFKVVRREESVKDGGGRRTRQVLRLEKSKQNFKKEELVAWK